MSNDKLREFSEWLDTYRDLPVHEVFHEIVLRYEEALATTEPEPTGMPEVKPWDHPEPQTMRWSDLEIRWIQSYGEQCWKAGYKHGAFSK